ncbi:MAG: FHA domain-containing protein [Anaerolineae bacterium]|nr:FHA domain-containing protein [Anaerolineae bacterium]
MRRSHFVSVVLFVLISLLLVPVQSGAAGTGPFVFVQGIPDTTSAPPEVRTHVSVIDQATSAVIEGLAAEHFRLKEGQEEIGIERLSYEPVGLALVTVIDRGGISAPGDKRIKDAIELNRELVSRLSVVGAPDDDMIAIVPVTGEEAKESPPLAEWIGDCQPGRQFSYEPVDINLVLNCLTAMEGKTVRGGTPLYEGLEEAIEVLARNTDARLREVLSHRRKVIVVFSDGIDPDFSDEAREGDIIREAQEAGISIYAVGMAQRGQQLRHEKNLIRLSDQTYGLYMLHNSDETRLQVLDLFSRIMTQRNQYLIVHRTGMPKGDYSLTITVETPVGSAETKTTFSSVLELPQMTLIEPADGSQFTVPYSRTLGSFIATPVTIRVQIVSQDGAERFPAEVHYLANGVEIGKATAPPSYDFTYELSTVVTPTEEVQTGRYTLVAQAIDPYLGTKMESNPVSIEVTWQAKEVTVPEEVVETAKTNWCAILPLPLIFLALLILGILIIRTRGEISRKVAQTTTALKGVTRRLSDMPQRAPGKLVIIHGANVGRELRLAAQVLKVGRDPQFCDFALYDEYVSNPHFSIRQEQSQFYITDEGSTNGTRVNGVMIPPHQPVPLHPDSIIEVGQTRLQFKRLGGPTQQLGRLGGPPIQPSPPPGPTVGGPTRIVR